MFTSGPSQAGAIDPIEAFARERLGCNCADAVFRQIRIETAGDGCLIDIGGRLLIELMTVGESADVGALLHRGQQERKRRGMNRYRLVLPDSAHPDPLPPMPDERVHLHRLPSAEIRALIAHCRTRLRPETL
jgi:hypothetical protein